VERSLAHSKTIRGLRAQLATATQLNGVALFCRTVAGDLNEGFGHIISSLQDAANLTEDAAQRQEARTAMENLRASLAPLQVLAADEEVRDETADLDAILRQSGALLRRLTGEHIRLELPSTSGALSVMGEASEILRIVVALICHASERTPNGGQLTVVVGQMETGEQLCATSGQCSVPWPCVRLAIGDEGSPLSEFELALLMNTELDAPDLPTAQPVSRLAKLVHSAGGLITAEARPLGGVDWLVALPAAISVV